MAERCESGQGEYTRDGSVDLRGNPVLRSKGGGWPACGYVVGKASTRLLVRSSNPQIAYFLSCQMRLHTLKLKYTILAGSTKSNPEIYFPLALKGPYLTQTYDIRFP